jgi:hypothetical protein
MAQAAAVFADVVKILYQSVDKRYDKREKRIINSTGGDVNDIF